MDRKIRIYKSFEEEEEDRRSYFRNLDKFDRLRIVYERVTKYYSLDKKSKSLRGKKWNIEWL